MERTRILVVDDELVIRESLTGWLKRDGYHVQNVPSGEDAMDELMLYEWPGNVRELSNAIERAVVVCKTRTITPLDLPIVKTLENELKNRYFSLNDVEKHHISKILNETGWNISKSSTILGIDRSTLYNKIKQYDLTDTRPKP